MYGVSPVSSSPSAADVSDLAGEYVLGTLSARQRRDVEQRLAQEPALQAAVEEWEARLLPLITLVPAVSPSPRLWPRVIRSLDAMEPVATSAPRASRYGVRDSLWRSLAFWRGLTVAGFTAAAIAMMILPAQFGTPETRFMVVLVAPGDKSPGWVVQARTDQRVELIPLGMLQVPADKSLQFWTKADDWKVPVSLGIVQPGERVTVPLDNLPGLQKNQLFELTLEPRTGSPTGRPTGPIQFIGRAVQVY
ncbi:anti-sigma-K factor RskA [Advenella incenata]|uniref:Regulator of SigK n=1 Tax=Advenella incenata TaxID=267800 RepID=A0A4Q7VTL0_9BURK|nr:anti-sigma-K factor RskA [Advenella incenata]